MNSKRGRWFLLSLIVAFLVAACALQRPVPFEAQSLSLADGNWQQKADNLVFVLDTSASMLHSHNGLEKFNIAKGLIANFNQTMPDLKLKTAIRTFGHDPSFSADKTKLAYGMTDYSRPELAAALGKIKPAGGRSPMDKALSAVAGDLKDATGNIAMVVVSDGKNIGDAPLAAAADLKAQYGDRLCIYTVLVGDNAAGQKLLADLSAVTGCGTTISADDLSTGPQMADFVKTVLLEPVPAPKPVPAPAPKAQMPAKSERGTWVFNDIKFEFDKATLMASSYPTLEKIYAALRDNPELRVEIQGHTCWIGTEEYNMGLSERRANTVMNYLIDKGIDGSRMTAKGYGESQPVDTNKTFEGRANNRRVELKPIQ